MSKVTCKNCGKEFKLRKVHSDELGYHAVCPACESSFDIEITREMMVEEGVERMKMLKMLSNPIKEFEKKGKLNLSERGILYWLDEAQQKVVNDFEERTGGVVYHVIHDYTNLGEMLSLMYVSKHQEEWDIDREDLKDGIALVHVENLTCPDCSEMGSIGVKPLFGGVARVW